MITEFDWLKKWNMYAPEKPAILEYATGRTFTYKQLNNLSNLFAKYLLDNYSIKKSDRVAVLAENRIEYAILFGVAQKIGITLVPLNYRLAKKELEYIISDCEPALIIYEKKFSEKIDITSNSTELLSMDKPESKILDYLSNQEELENIFIEINENDPIFILYTSGTTAFPKGAIYTHKMLFWNSINTEIRLSITSEDKSISCAPPFHTGGWNVLFTPFLHHGAFTVLLKKFDAETELKLMDELGITIYWAVPTMLKMMASAEIFSKTKMTQLRYIIVGGEALPLDVINTWHQKGVPIRQGYGLTEVGPNVTSLNQEDATRKLGSIGTENFYIKTKIIAEDGSEVIGEGTGELLLRGSNVTPGYWKNNEATAKSIKDGWFSTGDIVKRDSEGYLYIVDRIKNMYISGGENVYPAEVEHIIRKHPAIIDAAIIGVADQKWGEVGKAFIVLEENENLTFEDLREFCIKNLAKYKIPKYMEILKKLPTNDSGKIDRKKLKSLEF